MGFNLLSFQALIIKLTGVRVIYFLVFRKISFAQSSMQRSGDGKRNLIHFLLSFCCTGNGAHFCDWLCQRQPNNIYYIKLLNNYVYNQLYKTWQLGSTKVLVLEQFIRHHQKNNNNWTTFKLYISLLTLSFA